MVLIDWLMIFSWRPRSVFILFLYVSCCLTKEDSLISSLIIDSIDCSIVPCLMQSVLWLSFLAAIVPNHALAIHSKCFLPWCPQCNIYGIPSIKTLPCFDAFDFLSNQIVVPFHLCLHQRNLKNSPVNNCPPCVLGLSKTMNIDINYFLQLSCGKSWCSPEKLKCPRQEIEGPLQKSFCNNMCLQKIASSNAVPENGGLQ